MSLRVGVVIPVHDEARSIARVVRGARRLRGEGVARVVVVDDGSRDDSAARARAAGAAVVRLERRRGKGHAVRAGARHLFATDRELDAVLLMDGDGQHRPEEIPRLLRARERGAALVLGDRSAQWDRVPRLRRWTNIVMTAIVRRLTGWPLRDSQCGFRLVSRRLWERLELVSERFEIETEMLLAAARVTSSDPSALAIEQVPVTARYGSERSKIRAAPDAWRFLRCLGRPRAQAASGVRHG